MECAIAALCGSDAYRFAVADFDSWLFVGSRGARVAFVDFKEAS